MKKFAFFILIILISCNPSRNEEEGTMEKHDMLFELLSNTQTNILFNNKLVETSQMNALNYDYMYNGAGVAVGDFNQDGLTDLYFVANQLPNQLYLNRGDMKFEDVSDISLTGGKEGFSTGVSVVDINMDGLLDIYVCRSGAFDDPEMRRNELFVNTGNDANGVPVFEELAAKYNLDLPHYSTQASFFDYDRDGDLDMFLINHNVNSEVHYAFDKYQNKLSNETSDRLFRNDNTVFTDVSKQAGLINDGIGFGLGLAIGDLNNDHWPDVIVGQDFASKDRIYINQKNGTFKEVASEVTGHISNFSMGNDLADFNNDGWLDFMSLDMMSEDNYGIKASMSGMNPKRFDEMLQKGFHYQYMYNALQLNSGIGDNNNPSFSDIAAMAGVSSTDWSWAPLFFDMDNDGDKDLFVSNGIKRDFRNVDYLHYRERAEAAFLEKVKNVSPTLRALAQQQHDSDLIRRMPPRLKNNYFYENNGDLQFVKRAKEWAPERIDASNGAAYADLDNDGDLDLVTNNMDDLASVYQNNSIQLDMGNYLRVKLNGPTKNLNGIGTRVTLKTKNNTQILEQYGSRGFQSTVENILHFGLGDASEIVELQVLWPDGKGQSLRPAKINDLISLDYNNASNRDLKDEIPSVVIQTITEQTGLRHFSKENDFDDFSRESLLPHKLSQEGPALAVGDVDDDGLADFYIGGAKGQAGKLYLQKGNGGFELSKQAAFQRSHSYEDVDASFFDVDGDGDLDLYVVSGSNEYEIGSEFYMDRIYINENAKLKQIKSPFDKKMPVSGSIVRPYDFDADGDMDLFVGGRQVPGQYPQTGTSILWRNDSMGGTIQFTKVENDLPEKLGMVTDAVWADVDGDNLAELIVGGEWMPIKIFKIENGSFTDISKGTALDENVGWWFGIQAGDFDNDGDVDLVAGNLGLNSKYKASLEEPFEIYANDFDQTGSLDIVLGYHQEGESYPLRGRECSSNQMPFIKKKFPNYHSFASANIEQVYGKENLDEALKHSATNFASCYLENNGSGQFKIKALPALAQLTLIKDIVTEDVDDDGNMDILLFGNYLGFEVETPRQDAGYGLVLLGNGKGDFKSLMPHESGLFVKGEVANVRLIKLAEEHRGLLIAKNNDFMELINIGNRTIEKSTSQ